MTFDYLTPEQSQRAEALHAAATSFGSPTQPTDDYLVRAANWIITGHHDSLFPLQTIPGGHLDGGTVDQAPLNYGRDFHQAHAGPTLEEVDGENTEN